MNNLDKNDINKITSKLKEKGFDTSLGIPHFASISLNQIPDDPESIKGNKTIGSNEVTGIGRTWVAHQATINMPTPAVAQACSLMLEGGADTIV